MVGDPEAGAWPVGPAVVTSSADPDAVGVPRAECVVEGQAVAEVSHQSHLPARSRRWPIGSRGTESLAAVHAEVVEPDSRVAVQVDQSPRGLDLLRDGVRGAGIARRGRWSSGWGQSTVSVSFAVRGRHSRRDEGLSADRACPVHPSPAGPLPATGSRGTGHVRPVTPYDEPDVPGVSTGQITTSD